MTDRFINDDLLNTYLSQKYHWKTLLPHQVYAMAYELKKRREGIMADDQEDTEKWTEDDNQDQEQFPIYRRNYLCPECHYAGGDHHPHCPNS